MRVVSACGDGRFLCDGGTCSDVPCDLANPILNISASSSPSRRGRARGPGSSPNGAFAPTHPTLTLTLPPSTPNLPPFHTADIAAAFLVPFGVAPSMGGAGQALIQGLGLAPPQLRPCASAGAAGGGGGCAAVAVDVEGADVSGSIRVQVWFW